MSKVYAKVGGEWHEAIVTTHPEFSHQSVLKLQCTGQLVLRPINPELRRRGVGAPERTSAQGLTLCACCAKPESERGPRRAAIEAKFRGSAAAIRAAVNSARGRVVRAGRPTSVSSR